MQQLSILLSTILLFSCSPELQVAKNSNSISFTIKNMSDDEYPDNPDIGFRAADYKNDFFKNGKIINNEDPFLWTFEFYTNDNDTIMLETLNISEFIPTIPSHVKKDEYLSHVSCINQEWNRNQVKFVNNEFKSSLNKVVRVDLARNCLNSYLWEIIIYTDENAKNVPYAHGWFNFPNKTYAQLFELKNNASFSKFNDEMENWIDPENKPVDFLKLRTITDSLEVNFQDLSDAMYPLQSARKKKYKEIIYPDTFSTMRDLQSDSTLFATFSIPGFYNKKEPRRSELGRLYHLKSIGINKITSPVSPDSLFEFKLTFEHKITAIETNLIIGGIDLKDIPVLETKDANNGWKNSMGIGNHTFYESYDQHQNYKSESSSYYAMFTDEKGNWLDSHKIGVDGPVFHFSDAEKTTLHLWLLSFERHAFVGHYSINLK